MKDVTTVGATDYFNQQYKQYIGWTNLPHVPICPSLPIDKLTTQISQSVGMLYHLKKYLSFNNLKLVYHALIKSRLQYGIVLWGNANQSALKKP